MLSFSFFRFRAQVTWISAQATKATKWRESNFSKTFWAVSRSTASPTPTKIRTTYSTTWAHRVHPVRIISWANVYTNAALNASNVTSYAHMQAVPPPLGYQHPVVYGHPTPQYLTHTMHQPYPINQPSMLGPGRVGRPNQVRYIEYRMCRTVTGAVRNRFYVLFVLLEGVRDLGTAEALIFPKNWLYVGQRPWDY